MSKLDLHTHSYFSKSLHKGFGYKPTSSPKHIIEAALKKEIDVLAVTDHDNIQGSLHTIKLAEEKYKGEILIIPGVEVSSKQGHILAYNIYEDIPKKLSAIEIIKRIKDLGGVAVAAHPFNIKYSLSKRLCHQLKDKLFAFEVSNSHAYKNKQVQKFVEENDLAYTMGSDAHFVGEIGLCHGITKKKIKTISQFLKVIKNKEIDNIVTNNKRLVRRVAPNLIRTCLYWRRQQIKNLTKLSRLPYKNKISNGKD